MTTTFNLKANPREKTGSAESRRIRKSGQVPAVIHNKDGKSVHISVVGKELEREYLKGNLFSSIAEIELNGKKIKAIPHGIELNPVTDRLDHVDFVGFESNSKVKAKVKLAFINRDKSPGIKKGGFLHIVLRKIEVICDPKAIPEAIEIDVGASQVGTKFRGSNLNLPKDVVLTNKSNFIVASLLGRGSKVEEEAAAATTPAAGAAGTTTPAASAPASDKKAADKKPAEKKDAKK